ncbi:MAG: hypothetical protein H6668_06160 [Ardenticatenaceae bacterium]|nr:hypothetical protein [Ardenticatenaceae bacterium]
MSAIFITILKSKWGYPNEFIRSYKKERVGTNALPISQTFLTFSHAACISLFIALPFALIHLAAVNQHYGQAFYTQIRMKPMVFASQVSQKPWVSNGTEYSTVTF